uniref:RING-type domain-containing protein n=1 Tax=Eutreptiella gymnastica TaxID=73025 RepID=A0A7S1IYE8_9EUGL|mmetsp:Transcript_50935/g.91029  ORF Transcript_50935/g.91029 Transcript_50935/m.91029 type:complete len:475 (+) Transcript_50935:48-1472(+)
MDDDIIIPGYGHRLRAGDDLSRAIPIAGNAFPLHKPKPRPMTEDERALRELEAMNARVGFIKTYPIPEHMGPSSSQSARLERHRQVTQSDIKQRREAALQQSLWRRQQATGVRNSQTGFTSCRELQEARRSLNDFGGSLAEVLESPSAVRERKRQNQQLNTGQRSTLRQGYSTGPDCTHRPTSQRAPTPERTHRSAAPPRMQLADPPRQVFTPAYPTPVDVPAPTSARSPSLSSLQSHPDPELAPEEVDSLARALHMDPARTEQVLDTLYDTVTDLYDAINSIVAGRADPPDPRPPPSTYGSGRAPPEPIAPVEPPQRLVAAPGGRQTGPVVPRYHTPYANHWDGVESTAWRPSRRIVHRSSSAHPAVDRSQESGWELSDFSYENLLELGSMAVQVGLTKQQIARIRKFLYADGRHKNLTNVKDCPICLEAFQPASRCQMLQCEHVFHEDCLVPWLLKNKKCPCCRHDVGRSKP